MDQINTNEQANEKNYFPVKSPLSWDEYFMLQAMMASLSLKIHRQKSALYLLMSIITRSLWDIMVLSQV